MVLKIRLYGKLRKLAQNFDEASGKIGLVELEADPFNKISDVLKHFKIEENEISHLFLNGEYSSKNRRISNGDRLAIFPKDMALLYKWYFPVKNGESSQP